MSSTDLLNALAAQLGREKVVAMCEAFLKPSAAGKMKKLKEAAAPAASAASAEDKPKRVLPFKLVQWQAFVRYVKERFPERFEGVKGAPAMQAVCKSLKEEEGVWEAFEASDACPQPALPPAPNTGRPAPRNSPGPMPADSDEETEDEAAPAPAGEAKPKRKWSEAAKASAKAKRAAKKAASASGSDSESVASAGSKKEKAE
jgi:hypothetical protein